MSVKPQWGFPCNVHAVVTLRAGGQSENSYRGLNLGDHVGDLASNVAENREYIKRELELPDDPFWLNQSHSSKVANLNSPRASRDADAAYACDTQDVLAVLSADCLPIILCSADGREIAAIHAGWRGLHAGVIEATLCEFRCPKNEISAWLGPCIRAENYEVRIDLKQLFTSKNAALESAFRTYKSRYYFDLAFVATTILSNHGLEKIDDSGLCTYLEQDRFFSYRRDGVTGRFATLIWRNN